jgi:hypothetical protein
LNSLVESIEPITAAIDGLSLEHVVCVTSAPKNIKISSRVDDDVNARANDTIPLTPPSFALNFCTRFCKYYEL